MSPQDGGDTPWSELVEKSLTEWDDPEEETAATEEEAPAEGEAPAGEEAASVDVPSSGEPSAITETPGDSGPTPIGGEAGTVTANPVRSSKYKAGTAVLTSCRHDPETAQVAYRANFSLREDKIGEAEKTADLFAASSAGHAELVSKLLDGEGAALEVAGTDQCAFHTVTV